MDNTTINNGVFEFVIMEQVEKKLKALLLYAQMLDLISFNPDSETHCEHINIDGVINDLLDEITTRRIKELCKRHGFECSNDFIDVIGACSDGAEVQHIIQNAERKYYLAYHTRILSQIPVDDGQKDLPFDAE